MGEMKTMKKLFKKVCQTVLAAALLCTLTLPQDVVLASQTNTSTAGFQMNGTTVTGYNGSGGSITLPDNATAIAASAFSGKSNISAVTIPSSVTSIGDSAFANCTGLTSITVPGSVSSLGTGVFSGCTRLSSVTMQAAVSSIPSNTFSGCSALTSVAISSSINSIGSSAFANCKSLSSMAVPGGVTTIGSGAFSGCSGLSGISIPSSTSSISTDAFNGCSALTTINVAGGNGTYASDGGCLYNASYTKLLICPQAKSSIALNSALKIIGGGAFNGCSRITSLTVPNGATTIESGAFSNSGIKNVTIPSSVTSIGSQSWSPDIIYGYGNSEAESYAESNNYVFYRLDGNGGGDPNDESQEIQTGNANYEDLEGDEDGDDENQNIVVDEGGSTGGSSNSNISTGGSKKPSSGSGSSGAYATKTSNVHQADTTPKTGDGFNPKILICVALVLIGCACFFLGRRKSA